MWCLLAVCVRVCAQHARCQAGQYLHDIGIIHGDLSGNNVLLKTKPQY